MNKAFFAATLALAASATCHADSWEQEQARRNERVSNSSVTRADSHWNNNDTKRDRRARQARQPIHSPHVEHDHPKPTVMTHCNGGFCYDNLGGAYHRNGDKLMTGPGGSACMVMGNTVQCR